MTKERIEQIIDTYSEFNRWLNKLQEWERFCIISMMKVAVNEAIEECDTEAKMALKHLEAINEGVSFRILNLKIKDQCDQ